MRKIISKYKEEKRRKRNGIVIGLILVGIMVFSILGYSFSGGEKTNSNKITYHNLEFEEQNGFWSTNIGNTLFVFKYNPTQVEEIDANLSNVNNYYNKPLYIYSENKEAESEIYRNLFYQNQIVQRMQYACLEGETCEEDLPVKTCEDNFIIIKEANISKITQDENCAIIEGEQANLTKVSDEFLFRIFGIR
ncbi:MAG: hypothetical protein ACFFG0_12845 [Candidatus Thorarchaeota archaeon]